MQKWMNGFLLGAMTLVASAAKAEPVDVRIIYALPYAEEYAGFDRFTLKIQRASLDQGWLTVRYEVPPDLLGRDSRFMTMSGRLDADGDNVDLFCGETGSDARCVKANGRLSCSVKFRSLTPDAIQVESFLRGKYGEDGNLAERLFASHVFGLDAIGTFDIVVTP